MIRLFAKAGTGLFASRTLIGHLLRGGAAFALLHAAIVHQHRHPALALLGALLALLLMRGCPACWALGLVETLGQKFTARRRSGTRGE